MRCKALFSLILSGSFSAVFADFSFDQSTKFTGGAMAGAMKMAGVFSKAARAPMDSRVIVKGNRMATVMGDQITLIDLDKETMTSVDMQKKTYATITFTDMKRAMDKMMSRMRQQPDAETSFDVDVKKTGQSQVVGGMKADETILTITMRTKDAKSGKSADMVMTNHMWLAPTMSGYDEVQEFYKRMASKMAWNMGSSGFMTAMAAQQPGSQKGMAKLAEEASKLQGIPVLQVMRMRASGEGMPSEAEMAKAQQDATQAQQQQQQSQPQDAAAAAGAGRLGRLGGIAGGLGGFGRRKKEEPAQTTQAAATPQTASPSGATPAGTLMEITTEYSGFSTASVDPSKLEVPAGFKEVEHDMAKTLK